MTNTPQNISCCDDESDSSTLSVDEARTRIIESVSAVEGSVLLPIRHALGHVLAEDLCSRVNVPNQTNSAMDGYAVLGVDLPTGENKLSLTIIGTSWAGKPFPQKVSTGQCVRIMTGASMPDGADTVIMQEHVEKQEDSIEIDARHSVGQNVRAAGEDIQIGETIMRHGRRIQSADLGVIASAGIGELNVYRRLRVAFFSTGDELRSIGEDLEPGMVYDSNRYTLHGMLSQLNVDILDMGVIRDTREDTQKAFRTAAANADVVITSGGVSVGDADFVTDTLNELGKINFWKVAMKPGRPLAFGSLDNAVFFGLPGNPVSVMVTFMQFALPALKCMAGETVTKPVSFQVKTADTLKKRPGRTEFQRGYLYQNEKGELRVSSTGAQGSGILRSMHEANCFIILPQECCEAETGTLVDVQPFYGLL